MATSLWRQRMAVVALTGLALLGIATAAEQDKPPFYEFSHGGKTVYLLGSIHLGSNDFYPLPSQIEQAFTRAKVLVVEADVGGASADVQALLGKYGLGTETPDPKTAAVLNAYCRSRQQVCAALAPFAPWLQASQITVVQFAAMGFSPEAGVDVTLLERARGSKRILELEGVEYQFRLMSSLQASHQWAMVREAIEVKDADINKLVESWRRGELESLAQLMRESMEEGEDLTLLKILLWDRNYRMADTLMAMLEQPDMPDTLMVVVGAGHLVGEHSLTAILAGRRLAIRSSLGHCGEADHICHFD
ncbi:TraB/GumN family protein [Shewanella sp.]|uniref:TraB/GumN family protein n=1 Tax=Shewanella sp. TaxID=50422 RepID=UPI003568747D